MPWNVKRLCASITVLCLFGTSAANAGDSEIDLAIAKHRMGTLTVHTSPGAEVTVKQLRHEFWFGAAISNRPFGRRADPNHAAKYKEVFLENFNAAVTENALKWHVMEPPNLLCSSCRHRDPHVGVLGRRQLDTCIVLVQA